MEKIEYMCKYCGRKTTRPANMGMPQPGICNKRPKFNGKPLPHEWIVNRVK